MKWIGLLILLTPLLMFQNCTNVDFAASDKESRLGTPDPNNPGNPGTGVPDDNDPGLAGGHFDLDTSSRVYSLGHGETDKHEHEYDDKHDTTFVDFLNMASGFTRIQDNVTTTQRFYIIVANAQLSPGGTLEINGTDYPVTNYQANVASLNLPTYNLASLSSFKIKFNRDAITQGGLIGTVTGCVRANDAGVNGEYRNGALTFQILEANTAAINLATGTAATNGGLLWEATVFWHHDGDCY